MSDPSDPSDPHIACPTPPLEQHAALLFEAVRSAAEALKDDGWREKRQNDDVHGRFFSRDGHIAELNRTSHDGAVRRDRWIELGIFHSSCAGAAVLTSRGRTSARAALF